MQQKVQRLWNPTALCSGLSCELCHLGQVGEPLCAQFPHVQNKEAHLEDFKDPV